jgi:hypothetical protein
MGTDPRHPRQTEADHGEAGLKGQAKDRGGLLLASINYLSASPQYLFWGWNVQMKPINSKLHDKTGSYQDV